MKRLLLIVITVATFATASAVGAQSPSPLMLSQRDVPGFTLQGKPSCLAQDRSFDVSLAQAKREGWLSHCSEYWVGSQPNSYPGILVDIATFTRSAGASWGYGVNTRDEAISFSNGSGSRIVSGPNVGTKRQWAYTASSQYKPESGYGVTFQRGRYVVSVSVTYYRGRGESSTLAFRLARLVDARAMKR